MEMAAKWADIRGNAIEPQVQTTNKAKIEISFLTRLFFVIHEIPEA